MNEGKPTDFSFLIDDYLEDSQEGFEKISSALIALEKNPANMKQVDAIFRAVHTLKSSSSMIGFPEIADIAHTAENLLDYYRTEKIPLPPGIIDLFFDVTATFEKMIDSRSKGKGAVEADPALINRLNSAFSQDGLADAEGSSRQETGVSVEKESETEVIKTIRVNVSVLDALFNIVGELIITKNRLQTQIENLHDKNLNRTMSEMNHIVSEINNTVSEARLVPVDEIFRRFPRMVHELARKAGKKVDLEISGGEIEMDKGTLENIREPLMHLLRNAVDHGIETPAIREKAGKDPNGTIRLSAMRDEDSITIEVSDDGAGIDTKELKRVFVEKKFIPPDFAETISDRELLSMIFSPGTTTMEKVSNVSGRGVGLDVVQTQILKMGGDVEVDTGAGKGARFIMNLPVSTAIMKTLIIEVGDKTFAVPANIVLETMRVRNSDIKQVNGMSVLMIKGYAVPFHMLTKLFGQQSPPLPEFTVLIIRSGNYYAAVGVDEVSDQIDSIIKPFDPVARKMRGLSGGTILGDGRVILLLDILGLLGFGKIGGKHYEGKDQ